MVMVLYFLLTRKSLLLSCYDRDVVTAFNRCAFSFSLSCNRNCIQSNLLFYTVVQQNEEVESAYRLLVHVKRLGPSGRSGNPSQQKYEFDSRN